MTKHRDLLIIMVFAALAASLLALRILPGALQVMLGLPLALILPGYALSSAMFSRGALSTETRILFSLGLSIIVALIGGLALNWTPWGLQTSAWAVYLGGATLLFGVVAVWRGSRGAPAATKRQALTVSSSQVVLLVAAALVLISAGVMRLAGASQESTTFTELWMDASPEDTLHIGVRNMESAPLTYRLVMQVNGVPVQEWSEVALQPHDTWQTTVPLPDQASASDRVDLLLYKPDSPQVPYRHVFWLVK